MTNGYGHDNAAEPKKQESENPQSPVANEERTTETEKKPDPATKK